MSHYFLKTPTERIAFVLFAVAIFAAAASKAITNVSYADIIIDIPNQVPTSFPIKLPQDTTGEHTVSFNLFVSQFHPDRFYFAADDCLQSLVINGRTVEGTAIPFCDFARGRTVDIGSYIYPGKNVIGAVMRNDGGEGMFDFKTATTDAAFLFPFTLFAAAIIAYASYLLYVRKAKAWQFSIFWIAAVGIALRIYYFLGTPYWVRGHDTEGHIEYARYLIDHWSIPPIGQGWEFWQPPLYYLMIAIPAAVAGLAGVDAGVQSRIMQLCGLIASALVLWIAYGIGKMSLHPKDRPTVFWIFLGVFAFLPGLVFFAARINNDVLTALLGFAAIAFLLRWWKSADWKNCSLLSVMIGLSLLTKNTNLLLVPIAGTCLLLRRKTPWKKKFSMGAASLGIIFLIAAWLPAYRAITSDHQGFVGNIGNLHSGLKLDNKPHSYFTFNPVKIVAIPFNNAWSDDARRQQFPEYFYKSAFFGEFDFGNETKPLASLILLLSFIPLLLSLFGLGWSLRYKLYESLPFLAMGVFLLAGHAAFRFQYPYSPSQDFRYSVLVLLPFAHFLCIGISRIRPPVLQHLASILTGTFLLSCAVFLVHLA